MLSRTVQPPKIVVRWNVRTTPRRAIACGGRPVIEAPSSRTSPAVGGNSPVMTLISVVLPAPFGPISARISVLGSVRSTPSSATRPPKALHTERSSSTVPEERSIRCSALERFLAVVDFGRVERALLRDPLHHAHALVLDVV